MAKTKVVEPIKAIGLAKQALPDGTAKQQRALADKILELNSQKRGAAFESGQTVALGKGVSLAAPASTSGNEVKLSSPARMDPGGAFVPSSPAVASVPAVPAVPQQVPAKEDKSIKSASPDIIITDPGDTAVDLILKLTLEKIGGQELISLVRHDTVNGQNIIYQPVKNISDIAIAYNPQNIINIPDTADIFFKNFAIKLENHIPQYSPDAIYVDMIPRTNNVFFDAANTRVVVELENLKQDYEIDIQSVASGQIFNDTIYEEDIS